MDNEDQHGASHTYKRVKASGNALVINGNVYGHDSQLLGHTNHNDAKSALLRALYFKDMQKRKRQIDARAASPEYVKWIWTTSFAQWLESPQSFYWITGLPGSGKSTLMKHIADDKKTKATLEIDGHKWTVVHFFFDFRAGKDTANNNQGMLRSLFSQLVKSLPELFYPLIMRSTASSTRVCAFIDGLDEFQGPASELLGKIFELKSRTGIKLCLASRPYTHFKNQLSKHPHLAVQDYNDESIRLYSEGKWGDYRMSIHAALPQTLSNKLRAKARGIFLWARLAMDELLLGLTDGKHVEALERQLEQMPEGVEEMYQRILDRIEPCRRAEAAMLLHMIMHDERSEVGVEISRLYAALRSMPLETALKDKVVPVIEENNDGRILALLGDFLDYIEPPDELLQNECPLLLIFEGNRLTRRRGYLARVSLTHETLVPFLSASQWLDTNLPFTFSAPGGEFWLRLYAEEIDRCSVGTNITVTDVMARVIAFAASMEEHHRGYQKNSETNWAIVSGELLEALESWPRWTPLLPFALKDIPRQIRRVTADRLACLSTLHGIIENPLFLYHWFICKYRDWEATAFAVEHQWSDQCIRPWLHNFRRIDSLERSFKEIGPDITLAISHRLPRLLQSRMNCGRMSLAVEQQQLFDYAWKYFTAKHSWPPHFNERMETLALLLSWGCQIDSRQLCQLLKRGHYASFQEWQSIIELFSASLVQIALHEGAHDISCPASKVENVSRHGQGSSFLCHWAVTKLTKENREGVTSLLYFLLAQGEQVDSMNNYQEDPILVVILTRSLGRHCGALRKIVTVLQAGADVGAVGRNGTALDAAKRRVEECDLGRYPELHEQAEAALQLVQYCVDHNGALPANLDNYLERDLW